MTNNVRDVGTFPYVCVRKVYCTNLKHTHSIKYNTTEIFLIITCIVMLSLTLYTNVYVYITFPKNVATCLGLKKDNRCYSHKLYVSKLQTDL